MSMHALAYDDASAAGVRGTPGAAGKVAVRFLSHRVLVAAGGGLPRPLLVVVVLRLHGDAVSDEEGGVEADAKLADEVAVLRLLRLLHRLGKLGRAGACDRAQRR